MNVAKVITLKDGEVVLHILRRYWITLLPKILLAALFVYAPFFFMVPLVAAGTWGLAVFGACIATGAFLAIRLAVIWHWNAFIITTYRVVDVDQRGFFDRTVSEAPYERIQDASYRVHGLLGTLFGYGTVALQVAGDSVRLELRGVHAPKRMHHLITARMHEVGSAGSGPGVRSAKVAALLESAADMSDAEARAFVVALQEAMAGKRATRPPGWTDTDVEAFAPEDDDIRGPR